MGVPFALASKTGGDGDVFFFNERLCYEKAGRCTYMVKPPGFFFLFPSQSPTGAGAPIW